MYNTPGKANKQQQGATLVVSLIFLMIITTITVTSLQTSELEERMAGNFQNHNRAFQAAESALRDAENHLQAIVGLTGFNPDCDNGLCRNGNTFFQDILAREGKAINYGSQTGALPLNGVAQQPRYLIEGIKFNSNGGSVNDHQIRYRITAFGTGGDNSSEVILTTTFIK